MRENHRVTTLASVFAPCRRTLAISAGALALAAMGATARPAIAAEVAFVGADLGVAGDSNDSVDRWRTTSVPKPFDSLLSDGLYGTRGGVIYAVDSVGNLNTGQVTATDPLTFNNGTQTTLGASPDVTLVSTGQDSIATSFGYKLIDDPRSPPSDIESGGALRNGVALGTEVAMMNLTANASFPATGIRVGLFVNNTDSYDGTIRITQTGGTGSGSATAAQVNSGNPDLYFFDLTNVTPGDQFTLFLTKNAVQATGGNTNNNVIYGGITFDDVVPEPASMGAVGIVGLMLLARRRRYTRVCGA